ncbi:[3-methyl-2-oxobutanoate dehydrogenase[lipoamide]] kinase [Striga asiatica]|uniref:[3-methyl-2-oxobutanoate dehydrogenase[lipoamide]] kinase n=1 Tax=Striga asiatica TaxID=4170 RepID=A0A5A7QA57_STRAF|nr:[3-methyl-2-oxobutanoate dehydrogenase[lipoamide]] kinase [Striga asiatica]
MAATIVSLHAQPISSHRRTELHSPFPNSSAVPTAAPFLRLRPTALILRVEVKSSPGAKKARRAVKSVLPVPISARLVGFAVNGTIILTFMWVLRAFLEVICTLGSVVFVSILLVRGIWTGISYFQDGRGYREDDDEPQSWTSTRPAT